jgi:hypothetical protein
LPRRSICLALALVVCPIPALGQVEEAALERIRLLNHKAMDEFDGLEFDTAKTALEEAVEVARGADLTRNKALAPIYINLGVVYGAGFNDRLNAVKYFTEALILDPAAELDPMRVTPALEEMFASARENAERARKRARAAAFKHTPVDEGVVGKPVRVSARVGGELEAEQVILFFRTSGQSTFIPVVMQPTGRGRYVGVIPAEHVKGRSIYYYIEAQDAAGQRLKGHGFATSPNIIALKPAKRPVRRRKPEPKKKKNISLAVMVGSGVGVVRGGRTENANASIEKDDTGGGDAGPGGALAPFHIAPEIAYHINDAWQIGLLGRIQIVNAITKQPSSGGIWKSNVSLLGVLRAKRLFRPDPLRFYVAFGAGGGQIRHRIPIANEHDTRVAQYVAFNVGGGMTYMFSSYVGLIVDLSGLILVPDFAAHLDLNAGLLFQF